MIGWRFLIEADGEALAAGVALPDALREYRFGGLNEGYLVWAFNEALAQAAQLREAEGARFEPRLLLVSALNVAALWLATTDAASSTFGPRDLLLPLRDSGPPFVPLEPIDVEGFVAVSRALARDLPTDNATGG